MKEETTRGKSIDDIRSEYAQKWDCQPEDLDIEVLDKPGFLSRQWKVRVCLKAEQSDLMSTPGMVCDVVEVDGPNLQIQTAWNAAEKKYTIHLTSSVRQIIPYPEAGALLWNGEVQLESFRVTEEDEIEFIPNESLGQRTWELVIRENGLTAVAKVDQEKPGRYELPELITADVRLRWEDIVVWKETLPEGEYWDQKHLQEDIQRLKIVHGIRSEAWAEIMCVEGNGEVVVAKATLPLAPIPARFEDFVGECSKGYEENEDRIDFFASKKNFINEGTILARKIPGKEGVEGKDVLDRPIPPLPLKDIQFKLKKNVKLSEDGLEVVATSAGIPVRVDEITYLVENIYLLNQDVDLATGSIEFPSEVFVYGNVQDGLHVYSGGKVEIQGSVSKAEIRAEKGLKVFHNVLGGHLVVGARYVVRSELLRRMREFHEDLTPCLMQTTELFSSPEAERLKPGQCLKLIMERRFPDLPKIATDLEKFVLGTKDDLLTQEIVLLIRTAKRFLVGLGPLDPQALPLLQRVNQALEQLVLNISLEVPEKLECEVDYIQGATVECGGSFTCFKGTYNSTIQTGGDVKIEGVCRGGKVISSGNVEIRELGGSGVSITTVQLPGTKRLKVEYCHPNVMIVVDKEIIHIEEGYRQLEVYRERGKVQVERLKAMAR
ncbi:FapA family protein [Desulfitobacterium metallireducens]|uniref:Polymerase n=1 Tax=Desulfitobacterium metallireducens DSM 15288 TaxID=871968 RepID=W0EFB3_9FIRM|nr:FapA family protein [Desulfitobacterium metallireducens]AHF07751.1 polymerase [Desulfitobacterium metallireducens DSM 15288]